MNFQKFICSVSNGYLSVELNEKNIIIFTHRDLYDCLWKTEIAIFSSTPLITNDVIFEELRQYFFNKKSEITDVLWCDEIDAKYLKFTIRHNDYSVPLVMVTLSAISKVVLLINKLSKSSTPGDIQELKNIVPKLIDQADYYKNLERQNHNTMIRIQKH